MKSTKEELEDVGKRIRAYRKIQDISMKELGQKVGLSETMIWRYENGETKGLNVNTIKKIASALNTNAENILGWVDQDISFDTLTNVIPITKTKKVPMLGSVACGEPIYMDETVGEFCPVDSSIHADFCLKAQGDSMTGARINDGDIVFVHSSPEVENGQIAVVAIGDEATLKYFYQYGDTVVLRPANPKYKEMTYHKDELNNIRILGRAIAFQSVI